MTYQVIIQVLATDSLAGVFTIICGLLTLERDNIQFGLKILIALEAFIAFGLILLLIWG